MYVYNISDDIVIIYDYLPSGIIVMDCSNGTTTIIGIQRRSGRRYKNLRTAGKGLGADYGNDILELLPQ